MLKAHTSSFVAGELLVRLSGRPQLSETQELLEKNQWKLLDRFEMRGIESGDGDILHLKLAPGETVEEARKRLAGDPRVAYTATNDRLESFGRVRPDDLDPRLWGLSNWGQEGGKAGADISATEAWSVTTGGHQPPLIGIIDSGIDYSHPELATNLWTNPGEVANGVDDDGNGIVDDIHGYDPANQDGDPMDDGSHGTHVAGTIAARGHNGRGVTGVAWRAQLMGLKFLAGGFGNIADAISALQYAEAHGARITSNSWGGSRYNQALKDVLAESSALHICAAGNSANDSDEKPLYPAAYDLPNIVSVAATNRRDELASFSNYGRMSVDLAAPGRDILSTIPGGDYGFKSGTSMATPHVTGAASLILERFPSLSNEELKDRLLFSTDRVADLEGKVVSNGRLNVARALEYDPVLPGAPSGLRAEALGHDRVGVSWHASGDDGRSGQAAAFELRWSHQPLNEENFDRGVPVLTPAPGFLGQKHSLELPLVPSGEEREIHLALRAVDNVGQKSELVSQSATVPAARVAFEDSGESGAAAWTVEGDWGLVDYPGRGKVWADSPNGNYGEGRNDSLTSKSFSLVGFEEPKLSFDVRHDLEINFDKVFLEVSQDGENWEQLDRFNRFSGWTRKEYTLADYAGSDAVQVRFRLETDRDVVMDGLYFDNLVVT